MGHERCTTWTILTCLVIGGAGTYTETRKVRLEKPPHDDVKVYQQIPKPRQAAVVVSTGSLSAPSGVTFVGPGWGSQSA